MMVTDLDITKEDISECMEESIDEASQESKKEQE